MNLFIVSSVGVTRNNIFFQKMSERRRNVERDYATNQHQPLKNATFCFI